MMGLMSGLLSLAAIAIFAVLQSEAENDDDDSNSGGDGGLMQPVTQRSNGPYLLSTRTNPARSYINHYLTESLTFRYYSVDGIA